LNIFITMPGVIDSLTTAISSRLRDNLVRVGLSHRFAVARQARW
jgi:hypothetical protein